MIKIFVSYGELLDKRSILEIKYDYITDENKQKNILFELNILIKESTDLLQTTELAHLYDELKEINLRLWKVENSIRIKEKNKEFDDQFIELARSVYFTNDQRAKIKKEINRVLESKIDEEKSYESY